jgi:hypothetical protein
MAHPIFEQLNTNTKLIKSILHAKITENGKDGITISPCPLHSMVNINGFTQENNWLVSKGINQRKLINAINKHVDIISTEINEALEHYLKITGMQIKPNDHGYHQLQYLKKELREIEPNTMQKAILKIASQIEELTREKVSDIGFTYASFLNLENRLKNLQAKHNKSKQAA